MGRVLREVRLPEECDAGNAGISLLLFAGLKWRH